MPIFAKIQSFVRNLFSSRRVEADLTQEVHAHLEMLREENVRAGMAPREAERAALLELGGIEQVKEQVREQRLGNWLHSVMSDCRFGLRQLRKSPGFTLIAILTLMLGIGANTALFSVVNGVLLNPLPFPQPEKLVAVYARTGDFQHSSISYPNFLDWCRGNRSFDALGAFRGDNFNLTGIGDPERLATNMVSAPFFPVLRVKPIVGRLFNEQDDRMGGAPVALITEGLWKRKFGGSQEIVGKSVTLNGTAYTISGVIPASFRFVNDNFNNAAELYVPLGQWDNPLFRDRRAAMGMNAVGRLKAGVTLDQANADMNAVAFHLAEIYPDTNKNSGVSLVALKEDWVGDIRLFLLVLLAAVGFVLLIACSNVANLLLARSTGRTREFAIRSALGASKTRVVRQLLTECVLLALVGGILGTLLAAWGTKGALKFLPEALPRAEEIRLDGRVLLFTLVVSVFAGILFGLIPAIRNSRTEVQDTLKEGGRGGSGARHRTQSIFVAVEMALAVILLVGAGLMIRSLSNLWNVNPGFDPNNVVSFRVASAQPFGDTPSGIRATLRQLRDTIAAIPGVQNASLTMGAQPMEGDSELPFWMEGEPKPASQDEMKQTLFYIVQSDYLKTMNIPLQRGRFLQESDSEDAPAVAVIDDHFAKKYFEDRDPIGKHITFDMVNKTAEIVGVVGHVNQWGLDSDATRSIQAQCYFPVAQIPDELMSAIPRSAGIVARSIQLSSLTDKTITRAVERLNGQMVVFGIQPMNQVVADSVASKRFAVILLGVFAAIALLLSSLGIYGVISYVVGERTHEIGIRMALGAKAANVLLMVLSQAGRMATAGVLVGLIGAALLTRLMASMLFGVSSRDPLTFVAVAVMLSLVALLACYIPARRASRVDPMVALRYE
jgi:predicted permease